MHRARSAVLSPAPQTSILHPARMNHPSSPSQLGRPASSHVAQREDFQNHENSSAALLVTSSPTKDSTHRLLAPGFNPRETKNMPAAEKVNSWLDCVPWAELGDGLWVLGCYPGTASVVSDSEHVHSVEGNDQDDLLERQSRQITRYVMKEYQNNGEDYSGILDGMRSGSSLCEPLYEEGFSFQ